MNYFSAAALTLALFAALGTAGADAATKKKKPTSASASLWEQCDAVCKSKFGAPYRVYKVQKMSKGKPQCWCTY